MHHVILYEFIIHQYVPLYCSKISVLCDTLNSILCLQWGSGGKIIQTLYGHNKRVNSVRWILGAENETELVSGSSDGTAILWSSKNGKYLSYVLRGHTGNVNIVDGLYKSLDKLQVIILTASDDRSIKIWSRFNGNNYNNKFT